MALQAASLAVSGARRAQQPAAVAAPVASRKSGFAGASVQCASASSRAVRSRAAAVTRAAIADPPPKSAKQYARPDASGRFGDYGGKYVPETLIAALEALEAEYTKIKADKAFQVSKQASSRARDSSIVMILCTWGASDRCPGQWLPLREATSHQRRVRLDLMTKIVPSRRPSSTVS